MICWAKMALLMAQIPEKMCLTTIGLLFLLFCCSSANGGNQGGAAGGTVSSDSVPPIFEEALGKFKKQGLFFDEHQPFRAKTVPDFNTCLERQDPFAVYLQPEEYHGFKNSRKNHYVGVGMEIEKTGRGTVACFPFSGSPAGKSGIENGDILLSVYGQDILGQSIYSVAAKLMGKPGTNVNLTIFKKNGEKRSFNLTRSSIRTGSVTVNSRSGIPIVKITNFGNSTRRDLKFILSQLPGSSPLVLDLRDNPGGDLYECIDTAMLFLAPEISIATVETRSGRQTYRSTTPVYDNASELYIWQNEYTASAAEVFIAALTQNMRAQSIGQKTYGKGTTQKIFELSDGSAIVFTIGYLRMPDDKRYHRLGLEPTHRLNGHQLTTENYLKKTRALLELHQP